MHKQRNDTWTFIGQKHDVTHTPYEDIFIPVKVTRIRLIRAEIWIATLILCEVQLWAGKRVKPSISPDINDLVSKQC